MRFFICLLDSEGRLISGALRRAYEALPRARGFAYKWQFIGQVPILVGGKDASDASFASLVATDGNSVAIGVVRLDNRLDLERWSGSRAGQLTDLALVLRTVARHGKKYIPQFLGDFAFVVWNAATRTAVAACDAFGVRKLYYTERNGLYAFASRGEALALEERYEVQYLAECVAMCAPSPGLTPYHGVRSVPGGTMAVLERAALHTHRFWSVDTFALDPTSAVSELGAIEACRDLLAESVRLRLGDAGDTWANLSGGMDSSSVVSLAQWLAAQGKASGGLAGTVTYVDSHGTGGDERRYSDEVAAHWGVRNETIIDAPVWQDTRYRPPFMDEPAISFLYYPRNLRVCDIVRSAGGKVLLTGGAGDTLFTGTMFFFADWLVRGHLWSAVREMARRAAIGRASFWELAYRNALLPLLPRFLQKRLVNDHGQMPGWVHQRAARRYGLYARAAPLAYNGHMGRKYSGAVAEGVRQLSTTIPGGVLEDSLDVRHPYLYRPLVEFASRLPPEMCVRPYARKWVLREAMRGILPEPVRTRVGKGTNHGLLAWSAATQHAIHEPLVRDTILADLGVVDAIKWKAAFEAAASEPDGREKVHSAIQKTLVVEAWLRMRSGRWPREGMVEKLYQ